MDIKYVNERTIYETIVGSRLYGIHNENSDYDKAGVMIPDKSYFYGFKRFEQFQGFEEDKVIYDIRKAIQLISDNNPNMLDLLHDNEKCIIKITPMWEKVIDNKDLFISKRCRFTYSGYSIAQLKRIKTHRKYLLNPPTKEPKRADFNLKDYSIFPSSQLKTVFHSVIDIVSEDKKPMFLDELDSIYRNYVSPIMTKYINSNQHQLAMEYLQLGVKSQSNSFMFLQSYLKDEYFEEAKKELDYFCKLQEWKQYLEWKKGRNKDRSVLEEKYGYDCKHAAHLVRLLRMGKEILLTGKINVDRINIDAEELKFIRKGGWKFEELEEYANSMDKLLEELYNNSALQKSPQIEKIGKLCEEIVETQLKI